MISYYLVEVEMGPQQTPMLWCHFQLQNTQTEEQSLLQTLSCPNVRKLVDISKLEGHLELDPCLVITSL